MSSRDTKNIPKNPDALKLFELKRTQVCGEVYACVRCNPRNLSAFGFFEVFLVSRKDIPNFDFFGAMFVEMVIEVLCCGLDDCLGGKSNDANSKNICWNWYSPSFDFFGYFLVASENIPNLDFTENLAKKGKAMDTMEHVMSCTTFSRRISSRRLPKHAHRR